MPIKKIDAAYVLSLPRMNRLERFYEGFPSDWPIPRPQFFHATDAQRVPLPDWWTDIPAMYGCNCGHRDIIARGLSEGHETIAIFEDDCGFFSGQTDVLREFLDQVPDDWHGAMIGGQISCFDGKTTPVTPRVSRCIQVERNHAYLLSRRGMEEFYRCLCEPNSIPIDHRWGNLQEQGKVNVYRCEPFICFQHEGASSISGRIEPARAWDSRVEFKLQLRDPKDVPIVSLVCPFDVLRELRKEGLVTNGGEDPPQFAVIEAGRVERGEVSIAETFLDASRSNPELFDNAVWKLRCDASLHRSAVFVLWHPSEVIPYPGARVITGETAEQVRAALANN